ncbi:zinc carboxypeptidase [Asbolus verrucosus]|uniref:Zinc carboxypeptidase A 1 n=1 Tax=Asbolus verrucosus TaxID=1661398 RepID=A0A482W7E6_ASBVE|nr:zinc carboxypeptidase [Asbolus verrucosus]
MNFVVTTCLLLATSSHIWGDQKIRYDNFVVHRLTPKTTEAVKALRALEEAPSGYDFWTAIRGVGYPVDVMVPPHLKYRFNDVINSGEFDAEVYISDVQKLIDNEKTNANINAWLTSLAESDPERVSEYLSPLVTKIDLSSLKQIFMLENGKTDLVISSAVATWVLNQLLTSEDPNVRQIAESHDWYVFPVFNPDGFVYSHTTDRMWRKTRVPYFLCSGADPNRNWGFHFNEGGSSSFPCSETYCGPEAFSEPSTKTLSEFISTIGSSLQAYIAFHSYSQLLLLPYGHTSQHLENYQDLYDVGKKAATSLAQRYNTEFQVGNIVDILYVASGGSMDWVKGTFGTPITYTYELRDTGRYGFVLPPDQIIPSAEEILDSLVTIFQEFDNILPNRKN